MKSSRAIPWSIGIAIVLIAMTACAYWLFFLAPLKTGGEVARKFKEFFDGTITVNKTVFIKGSSNLTELAVREKISLTPTTLRIAGGAAKRKSC
jgi:hypothetical protein